MPAIDGIYIELLMNQPQYTGSLQTLETVITT